MKYSPIVVILMVELCERVTYYTIAGTQKFFFQNNLGKAPGQAAAINSVFSMLCYMWCLPGGLLADTIGRYKTILAAGSVYILGTLLVGLSSFKETQHPLSSLFLIGSLFLIPLGTGGIKPNIANFGADQIGDQTEAARRCQKSYFSWFYLAINVGVFIAFGYFTNTTTLGVHIGSAQIVPEDEGYAFAYGAGAVFMLIAIGMFVGFSRLYTRLPGNGIGPFMTLAKHVCYSTTHGGGWRACMAAVGWVLLPIFFAVTMVSALMPAHGSGGDGSPTNATAPVADACLVAEVTARRLTAPERRLHGGSGSSAVLNELALVLGAVSVVCLVVSNLSTKYIQPMPKTARSDFSVEEVRQTFAMVPLILVLNIGFNLAYNAMNNAFPSSACQMDLMVGGSQLNGAFFNIADAIAIIVFTPVLESCLFPLIAKLKGSPVRLGQKVISGLLIAALSNGIAAYLEVQRRAAPYLCGPNAQFSKCAPGYESDPPAGTRMKQYSAFLIFIPFGLVGVAEVLVNPCLYCFSYEAAPPKVRSVAQAFNLFCMGCVSNAFTAVVTQATYPEDLDEGNLEYYYFVNIVLAFVGILLYFVLTRCFNHGKDVKKDMVAELDVAEEEFSDAEGRMEMANMDTSPR